MTNYEIIQQLEYIKTTTNQKIDMLISKLQVEGSPKKSTMPTTTVSRPIRNAGESNKWTEMTGDQVQMPNIII